MQLGTKQHHTKLEKVQDKIKTRYLAVGDDRETTAKFNLVRPVIGTLILLFHLAATF